MRADFVNIPGKDRVMSSQPTERFLALWKIDHDTHSIAQICRVDESAVYNALARHRQDKFNDTYARRSKVVRSVSIQVASESGSRLLPYAGAE